MSAEQWYLFLGVLLGTFGLVRHLSEKSPVTPAMIYFAIGLIFGPLVLGKLNLSFEADSGLLEHTTEFVVIVSVFASAMKLKLDARNRSWSVILRLAIVSMVLTIGLFALTSHFLFGLSLPVALLLGAILAPTDPVLASSVQVEDKEDRDRLRQALTGEASVNDSSAFPFVFLAMGFLGLRELGDFGEIWILKDLVWAITGSVGIGLLTGWGAAKAVVGARRAGWENLVLDDFVAIGLMAVSYGLAVLAETYGFVAVFVAGISFRHFFEQQSSRKDQEDDSNLDGMIRFHEQIERFGEVFAVIILGSLVGTVGFHWNDVLLAVLLFVVLRPLAVFLGLWGASVTWNQKKVIAWMGIRGIGSLYYLTFAINHGLPKDSALRISEIVVVVLSLSLFAHGFSSNKIMRWYQRRKSAGSSAGASS